MALDFPSSPTNGQTFVSGNRTWTYNTTTSSWEASSVATSKTANHVYAAPNGSAGIPDFRALVAADIPTLNQNTTGTAATITGVYSGTITSGQITTGLGFTPYNATNPSGYITGSGSITGSAGSLTGFTNSNSANPISGPDNLTNNGLAYVTGMSLLGQTDGALYTQAYSTNWVHQIYGDYRTGQIALRAKNNGAWQAWRINLDSGNYTSYAMPSGSSATNSVDVRAPIFYDSNNTNFYLDPASTSVLNGLTLTGGTHYIATDKLLLQHDGSHGYIRSMNAGSHLFLGGSNQNTIRLDTGNFLFSQGSVRSPIFYDSDNTSYYIDGASTSYLNAAYVNTSYVGRYFQRVTGEPTNNLGDPTVTEMALFQEQFNNKTEFYPIANIKFYTSTNGSTWTEYTSFSDTEKRKFVGGSGTSGINIPNATPYFRIEIINNGGYVFLNALYMYWSGNSHETTVKIRALKNGVWEQWTNSSTKVSSWPGHLYLPFNTIPFLAGSTGHYNTVHIDFQPTWSTGAYASNVISLYNMQVWGGYPAGKRTIYSVDENRNTTFPGDVRASLFYDSDDTAFYINPNSTSRFSSIQTVGITGIHSSGSTGIDMATNDNYVSMRVIRNSATSTSNDGMYIGYGNSNSGLTRLFGGGSTGGAFEKRSDHSFEPGSFRAPIFYDSDDTGYYIDPNTTSRFKRLVLDNGDNLSWGAVYGAGVPTIAGSTNTGIYFYPTGSTAGATFTMFGTYASATGSMRAPIFYDSNDTGYYTDPASTSKINYLYMPGGIAAETASVNYYENALEIRETAFGGSLTTSVSNAPRIGFHWSNRVGMQIGMDSDGVFNIWDGSAGGYNSLRAGTITAQASNDVQLYLNGNGTAWAGINWADVAGNDNIWYNGSGSTFAIGGGGSNVANKKLHVHGGMTIGSGIAASSSGVNNLLVESAITSNQMYSQIFYDSQNGAYYGDFASTSILRGLTLTDGSASMTFSSSTSGRTAAFGMTDAYNMYLNAPTNGILYLSTFQAPIMYDRDNSGYYIDPASVSNINSLVTQSAISNNVSGLRNINPAGGSYVTGASSVSGAIKIKLPETVYPMMRFTVRVYTYDGLSFDIYCGGHTSSALWYNTFAYMTTQNRSALNVRFTGDGTNMYVIIGELAQSWTYPQVFITDVQVGYTNYEYTRWDDGWVISFETSTYHTVGSTHQVFPPTSSTNNVNPAYASIYYDSNNTGYYVDPASTSQINQVNIAGNSTVFGGYGSGSGPGLAFENQGTFIRLAFHDLDFWDWNLGSSIFRLDNFAASSTSFRAPIFYDTDNTGYFINAASTSNIAGLQVNGTLDVRDSNAQFWRSTNGAYQRVDTRTEATSLSRAHWYGVNSSGGTSNFRHAWYDNAAYFNVTAQDGEIIFERTAGETIVRSTGSFRAPIFYDSNNTAYYINGDSTSAVKGAILIGPNVSGRYTRIGGDGGATDECTLSASNGNLHIDAKSGSNLYLSWYNTATTQVGGGIASTIYYDRDNTSYYVDPTSTTALRTVGSWRADSSAWDGEFNGKIQYHSNNWYFQAAGEWLFRRSDTTSAFWVTQAGVVQCIGDMRAPIFYDYNNTGYYCNPDGTSNFADVFIQGGVAGTANSADYPYAAIEIRERSFGGAQDDTWATAPRISFHWGGRVASQIVMSSNGRINVRNNPGTDYEAFQCGTFYAPIRYDSDNTVYYTNPAGTSVLSSIALGGATSVPQGALWMSGEIWISGNGNRVAFTTDTSTDGTPNTSVRGSSNDLIVQNWSGSATNDNFWIFGASRDAACAGNITAYYSDERLKTKTGNLDNALEKVISLEGFTYIENEVARSVGYNNSKQQVGLSAQKVKAVLPEAVALAPFDYDPQEDGTISSKSGEEYLTVDYSRLVPLLIEAIKEQQSHITKLEEKLNKLLGE